MHTSIRNRWSCSLHVRGNGNGNQTLPPSLDCSMRSALYYLVIVARSSRVRFFFSLKYVKYSIFPSIHIQSIYTAIRYNYNYKNIRKKKLYKIFTHFSFDIFHIHIHISLLSACGLSISNITHTSFALSMHKHNNK
jgi:hypothetical protein